MWHSDKQTPELLDALYACSLEHAFVVIKLFRKLTSCRLDKYNFSLFGKVKSGCTERAAHNFDKCIWL